MVSPAGVSLLLLSSLEVMKAPPSSSVWGGVWVSPAGAGTGAEVEVGVVAVGVATVLVLPDSM